MTVVLNEAAITAFFNQPGGLVQDMLVGHAERIQSAAVEEADLVVRNRFDTSRVIDLQVEEGPLRVLVGIFDQVGRMGQFLAFKAQEETGWLSRAVAKAREV